MSQKIIPGSRELAQQIRRRRQELGLTIEEAAERLSVSAKTIIRLLPQLGAVDAKKGVGRKRLIRIPEEGIAEYLAGCVIYPAVTAKRQEPKTVFYLERRRA